MYSVKLERRKRGGETRQERGKAKTENLNLGYLDKVLSLVFYPFETTLEDDAIWIFEFGSRVVLQIKTQDT